jgi:hypothetical protein
LLTGQDGPRPDDLYRLYYTEAFAAKSTGEPNHVNDRLVRTLRETDVGLVDEPALDVRLDRVPDKAVPWMTFEQRSSYALEVLTNLRRGLPKGPDDAVTSQLLTTRRNHVARLRRRAFFERRDDGWEDMLPYRSWRLLQAVVHGKTEENRQRDRSDLRDRVIEAISLSEGLRHAGVRRTQLALRVSRVKNPSIRSYRLFPKDQFSIVVSGVRGLADYLEYAPDAVDLEADPSKLGPARLRLSLDLLEMLDLIRCGYRPNSLDLQGLFVNLMIFRNELLNLPFKKVLVTPDDQQLFEIEAIPSVTGDIALRLAPVTDSSVGGAGL